MKFRSMGLAPLLAAGVAALTMTLAPTLAPLADASPSTSVNGAGRSSGSSGGGVQLDEVRVPGDVEINSSHAIRFPLLYPDFASRGIYHHGHRHH
jgi:hypothetical protein